MKLLGASLNVITYLMMRVADNEELAANETLVEEIEYWLDYVDQAIDEEDPIMVEIRNVFTHEIKEGYYFDKDGFEDNFKNFLEEHSGIKARVFFLSEFRKAKLEVEADIKQADRERIDKIIDMAKIGEITWEFAFEELKEV